MSGWVSCSAGVVESAAPGAAAGFFAALLLARIAPPRFGVAEILARGLAASLAGIAAIMLCLVVPRFLLVFGIAAWTDALRAAARNADLPLVAIAALGGCLSLTKTALLLRRRTGTAWIVADLAVTIGLAVALAAAYRWLWHVRTGLDPVSLVSFFDDQRVRAAVLSLPVAASGWVWVSTALAHQPEPRRRRLLGSAAAAACGLLGGLLAPF